MIRRWLCLLGLIPGMAMSQSFDKLVDQFFDEYYFAYSPTSGTSAGFHQYDTKLEDYSRAGVDRSVAELRKQQRAFEAIDVSKLNAVQKSDRELVLSRIHADLFSLLEIRGWETNPDTYSSGITNSVFVIMSRKFAPPDVRLRSVIARENLMPAVFAAARANLKNPPRIYTEIALEQLPGIRSFFEKDVPQAFLDVKDKPLLEEFQRSNKAVIGEIGKYEKFLKDDLLARSKGDFRIGAEKYRKKLLYDEMIDMPIEELLKQGYEDLRRNQQAFRDAAKRLSPEKSPETVLKDLEKDHPPAGELLNSFRQVLSGLREYIEKKHIVTIPSPVPPRLEETPPFMRALTFASMDTPGPFEKVATEAFFNVTLPEKSWTTAQVEEHMAAFNRAVIMSTAIHEAYPGHYVQFLWLQRAPSKARKLLGCSSNAEGWAHYAEQMMLDEGFGAR